MHIALLVLFTLEFNYMYVYSLIHFGCLLERGRKLYTEM
jgi:hypothetical protein